MEPQSFGYWLRRKRKSLDLTREGLAVQVGCSAATIRKIEDEERRPSVQIAERLADILGIAASDRNGFLRFARGEMLAAHAEAGETLPWRTATQPRSNLPAALTSLVGRAQEITDLTARLQDPHVRLVTLVGPPGIGKTRLSIAAAGAMRNAFESGVFFVGLATIHEPALVPMAVVQALGYAEQKNRSALDKLNDGIGDKNLLLVLDNCEHVIDAASELAAALLGHCPRLKIIATSRETLRIPGETQFPVDSLGVPSRSDSLDLADAARFPALTLFTERARAVNPKFSLTPQNLTAVAAICARLDGLPLAIELIATRTRLMPPQELLARMTADFILSSDGMRAVSARQKTLGNAIRWSYDTLSAQEKQVFTAVSVFAGGFTLEAAEAVCPPMLTGQTVIDIIAALADKSLLQRSSDPQGHIRFSMLVTVQQFACEQLHAFGIVQETQNRHLACVVALAEKSASQIHGPNQVGWIERLEVEHENVRRALAWSLTCHNTQAAIRLLSAVSWVWGLWRHNSEILDWFEQIKTLPYLERFPLLHARLLNHIAHSNWLAGKFQFARAALAHSLPLWKELGDAGVAGLAEAQCYQGMIAHSLESDYESAQSLFKQSMLLHQQCGNTWGIAFTALNLGWVFDHQDKNNLALLYLKQSLELFTQIGDLWGMGRANQFLGQFSLKEKDFENAQRYYAHHLEIDERLKFRPGMVIALGNLGDLFRHQQQHDEAASYYYKSLALCREFNIKIDRGYNYFALSLLGLQKNDYAFSQRYIIAYFESGVMVSQTLAACDLCYGMSAVAGGRGESERSAILHGATQSLLQINDIPYTPFDRAELDRHIQRARAQLGEAVFSALAAEGMAMPVEEAIAYALSTAGR